MFHVKRRRRKFCILRFRLKPKAHSLHCGSSFPPQTRCWFAAGVLLELQAPYSSSYREAVGLVHSAASLLSNRKRLPARGTPHPYTQRARVAGKPPTAAQSLVCGGSPFGNVILRRYLHLPQSACPAQRLSAAGSGRRERSRNRCRWRGGWETAARLRRWLPSCR